MNPSIRTTVATVALLLAAVSAQSQTQTRYTYSATGDEVIDSKTGLIWRRCSEGLTWNGSTCIGMIGIYTHEQALAHAQAQAGTAGWRLPNVKELASIVDRTRINPAIDPTAFPEPTPGHATWSSTPFTWNYGGDSGGGAWKVNFYDGYVFNLLTRGSSSHVRLVR